MTNILTFSPESPNTSENNLNHVDFETMGFTDAGKVGGSTSAFNISLERFFSRLLLNKDTQEYSVGSRNGEAEIKINMTKEKISAHNNEITRLQNKVLPEAEAKLNEATETMNEFKVNPTKFVKEEEDRLLLWIYGCLSLFITVFLYFFYSSVIYSAVFRDISITKYTIFNSIFYPKAIEEAYFKGLAALMLVLFAPFIFLGLGMAIEHVKTKKNNNYKYAWVGVALFTFLVDSLLAYHISERIYNSKAINTYGNVKPFSLFDAVTDLNFWIIIALGFCVYILFGYIFSLYNEQRLSKNKYKDFEKMLKEKVDNASADVEQIKENIKQLEEKIYSLNISISEVHKEYDKIFYSPNELIKIISDYALGWIKYLQNAKYQESDIQKIETALNNFYIQKGIK